MSTLLYYLVFSLIGLVLLLAGSWQSFSHAVFTALHCTQCSLSYTKAVRPSVCLSVRRVYCNKTNQSSANVLIPYERSIIPVLDNSKNGWWGRPFYLKFWAKLNSSRFKDGDFQSIFARSASALTPSAKSSITSKSKSTKDEQCTLPLSPQRGSITHINHFPLKVHFSRRKSAAKFLRLKTFSGKVVRHSLPM